MLSECRRAQDYARGTRGRPLGCPRYRQDPTIRHLDEAQKESGNALRAPQTHTRAGAAAITRSMRRKRRIPPRRHRPKPQKTGQNLSCTAESAKSLTRKALARRPKHRFLRQQYVVFQQNRRKADFRCRLRRRLSCGTKLPFAFAAIADAACSHACGTPFVAAQRLSSLRSFAGDDFDLTHTALSPRARQISMERDKPDLCSCGYC